MGRNRKGPKCPKCVDARRVATSLPVDGMRGMDGLGLLYFGSGDPRAESPLPRITRDKSTNMSNTCEVLNAISMIPGFFVSMRELRRFDPKTHVAERIAILSFTLVCWASIVFHLAATDDPWKETFLTLDVMMQQASALATLWVSEKNTTKRWSGGSSIRVAKSLAVVVLSAATTSSIRRRKHLSMWHVLSHAAVVFACNGHSIRWQWALALALRVFGQLVPNACSHSLFHLAVVVAFRSMWRSWSVEKSDMT